MFAAHHYGQPHIALDETVIYQKFLKQSKQNLSF